MNSRTFSQNPRDQNKDFAQLCCRVLQKYKFDLVAAEVPTISAAANITLSYKVHV